MIECACPISELLMTKREFISKSGDVFEWEENADVIKALKDLHDADVLDKLKKEFLKNETNND